MYATAAFYLAVALQLSNGLYDPVALALVLAAIVLVFVHRPDGARILEVGCIWGLCCAITRSSLFYGSSANIRWVAVVMLAGFFTRWRWWVVFGGFLAMGIAAIHASPAPHIDVWWWRSMAAEALVTGHNPYSGTYPNIYGAGSAFYDAAVLTPAGNILSYPYPPLTVLVDIFGLLLGDVRYSMLGLMLAAAALLRRDGNELGAMFLLLTPRTLFVLEQDWTEPLVLVCFLAARRSGVFLGLLAASKQSSPFLALPLALAAGPLDLFWAFMSFSAVTLPLALDNPLGFWRGVVVYQVHGMTRPDSLGLVALTQWRWLSPLGMLAAGALLWRKYSVAVAWLIVVVTYRQASCNYYWLAIGLLLVEGRRGCE